LELSELESGECDLSMRRLYDFYAGQMPYMRSFLRWYWCSELALARTTREVMGS
jgi:hypothetical protein